MSIKTIITESMLDHVYRLEQARKNEIENLGESVTIWPDRGQLKAVKDNDTFYFAQTAKVKPGIILSHVDYPTLFLITNITDQAGRLAAETIQLPNKVSFFTAVPVAVDIIGRAHYSIRAQNWSDVPCIVDKNRITLPLPYIPDLGDILRLGCCDDYKVIAVKKDNVTVTATVEEF